VLLLSELVNVGYARFYRADNDAKASCDEGPDEVLIIAPAAIGIVPTVSSYSSQCGAGGAN